MLSADPSHPGPKRIYNALADAAAASDSREVLRQVGQAEVFLNNSQTVDPVSRQTGLYNAEVIRNRLGELSGRSTGMSRVQVAGRSAVYSDDNPASAGYSPAARYQPPPARANHYADIHPDYASAVDGLAVKLRNAGDNRAFNSLREVIANGDRARLKTILQQVIDTSYGDILLSAQQAISWLQQ